MQTADRQRAALRLASAAAKPEGLFDRGRFSPAGAGYIICNCRRGSRRRARLATRCTSDGLAFRPRRTHGRRRRGRDGLPMHRCKPAAAADHCGLPRPRVTHHCSSPIPNNASGRSTGAPRARRMTRTCLNAPPWRARRPIAPSRGAMSTTRAASLGARATSGRSTFRRLKTSSTRT